MKRFFIVVISLVAIAIYFNIGHYMGERFKEAASARSIVVGFNFFAKADKFENDYELTIFEELFVLGKEGFLLPPNGKKTILDAKGIKYIYLFLWPIMSLFSILTWVFWIVFLGGLFTVKGAGVSTLFALLALIVFMLRYRPKSAKK